VVEAFAGSTTITMGESSVVSFVIAFCGVASGTVVNVLSPLDWQPEQHRTSSADNMLDNVPFFIGTSFYH
jgi:hypothetical protein